ncbi:hypothetical protein BC829DRAFT_403973, partial [Chytridium lagenaria]
MSPQYFFRIFALYPTPSLNSTTPQQSNMQSTFILALLLAFIAVITSAAPSGPPPVCSDNRVSAAANAYLASFPCVLRGWNSGFTPSNACQACNVDNLARVLTPVISACPSSEISVLQGRLIELKGTLDRACAQ